MDPMKARAAVPVHLPVSNPTTSYWQDPPDEIADYESSSSFPEKIDTLIIGCGITGVSVAYGLLTSNKLGGDTGKIVMLEARQACSGATGRNGGHTKSASYRSFESNTTTHGLPTAIAIATLEYETITSLHAFAQANDIACDLFTGDTVDIIYSRADWETAQSAVQAIRDAMPDKLDTVARYHFWTAEEVREKFNVRGKECVGAVSYQAGSLSAYRFVIGLLKLCLEFGLQLYTNTPAIKLSRSSDQSWEVTTPNGVISAKRVVLATNGYTAAIWPHFQEKIVPLRGQIEAQIPPSSLSELECTYSFIYPDGYEYMIPKPANSQFPSYPGDVIIGGGLAMLAAEGAEEFGISDDSTLNPQLTDYLGKCTERYFGVGDEWKVRQEWTGIMGFTGDGIPFIGEVPGEEDLWIAAAFQGHGMVLCWGCAKALVEMMDGEELGNFPDVFRISEERMGVEFGGRHS
ncbi:FAD dependent oxidoreductase [Calycina marina]|uniref:FAD dependent oxidoreductase n=1 Tax=Calycina marina TaxID=1763456 RepID=A0A9P7Z669_9HELO|nr:FAD dependent oxidoreductase [Calycina marina]